MQKTKRLTVTIASGKGGAGKTTVATAIGYELSRARTTLFVDLDFFNRGLTGLLVREDTAPITREAHTEDHSDDVTWRLTKIEERVFVLEFPIMSPAKITELQSRKVGRLAEWLRRVVDHASELCDAKTVVMDTHGGPDNVSFAACSVADHSILVSEPDRVTLYGTLHFIKQARLAIGNGANIHLVFNKVGPDLSEPFLTELFKNRLRQHFGQGRWLGVVPYDGQFVREFGNYRFLTAIFPYSIVTKKIGVLIVDMLGEESRDNMSKYSLFYVRFTKRAHRFLMDGRKTVVADPNGMLGVVAVVGLFVALPSVYELIFWYRPYSRILYSVQDIGLSILAFVGTWFLIVRIWKWFVIGDRRATMYARTRQYNGFALHGLYVASLSLLCGVFLGFWLE